MMNHFKPIGVLAVAATVAVGIASVSAHHSTTMFDHSITMTINGEVVELRWVNPHVSLSVNGVVKERAEDGPAVWVMEMTSPAISCAPVAGGATPSSPARRSRSCSARCATPSARGEH